MCITCFDLAEIKNEIICGDNKGQITVFDIDKGNLKRRVVIGDIGIADISISSGNNFAAIVLEDERTKLLDANKEYVNI